MKKFIFAFFFAVLSLAVVATVKPAEAKASDLRSDLRSDSWTDGAALRHAYKPTTVRETGWTRARVNNVSAQAQSRLVCVEAFNRKTGRKTHLGCLTLNLGGYKSMENNWGAEFDAPTAWLKPGSYRVVYTYEGADGNWHRIKSMNMTVSDGSFVATR